MSATLPAPRFAMTDHTARPFAAMMRLEDAIELGEGVHALVRVRASQINGCAFCIDMHWREARAAGESEQRLYSLDARSPRRLPSGSGASRPVRRRR
jgi:AhpD family alkylhydroperoxidase